MAEPFKAEDVWFRFVPSEEKDRAKEWLAVDEYAVVRSPLDPAEVVIYSYYEGAWRRDYSSASPFLIIARLLKERDEAQAELKEFARFILDKKKMIEDLKAERDDLAAKETALKHAIDDIIVTLAKVEAERDLYREALEEYATIRRWYHEQASNYPEGSDNCFRSPLKAYHGYDLARAALAQGTKIQEGK